MDEETEAQGVYPQVVQQGQSVENTDSKVHTQGMWSVGMMRLHHMRRKD